MSRQDSTDRSGPRTHGAALHAPPRERWGAFEIALLACAVLTVATTVAVLALLLRHTVGFFSEVSVASFLGDTRWAPLSRVNPRFGIWPLVAGTALTSLIAIVVATPLGVLSAVYLSELAPRRVSAIVRPILELLAGIPTVVFGYFALMTVTPALQRIVPGLATFSSLSAGVVVGVMITPMISSLSEDALRSVPGSLREAARALGGSRLSAIRHVIVPQARAGIGTSVVLALSRAMGETMIVTIAAGQQPQLTLDPRVPVETMTAYIVQVSLGATPSGTLAFRSIFVVGAVLFGFTYLMNAVARRLVRATSPTASAGGLR